MPGDVGGADWGGAGVNPQTGFLYVTSVTSPTIVGLDRGDEDGSGNMRYRRSADGRPADTRRSAALQAAVQPRHRLRPEHRHHRLADAARRRPAESSAADGAASRSAWQRSPCQRARHAGAALRQPGFRRPWPRREPFPSVGGPASTLPPEPQMFRAFDRKTGTLAWERARSARSSRRPDDLPRRWAPVRRRGHRLGCHHRTRRLRAPPPP